MSIPALDAALAGIGQLDLPALQAAWEEQFGRPPPRGLSRRLLEHAAAYEMQVKAYGGLKPALRRQLRRAAQLRPGSVPMRRARGILSPGSRLVREWQGRSHTVEVVEKGFLHAGRRYRSLSEVARAITGTRWSGPRFFGL